MACNANARTGSIARPLFMAWSRMDDLGLFQAYDGRIDRRGLAQSGSRVRWSQTCVDGWSS